MLISKAEAQFKSGDLAGAELSLKAVRDRAWGGVAPALGTVDIKKILNEYRHELSGEMSLWYDLRRSGSVVEYLLDTHGFTVPLGRDVMPIPASAIATNPSLIQNPHY